ncbi:MAG TPA: polysaccharide deacetylase family protein [Bacteroidota bacterium]|nr:polysaccharide deacetylase family protein [Bacteroidota bacterium]
MIPQVKNERYTDVGGKPQKQPQLPIKILMYHRVVKDLKLAHEFPLCIPSDEFRRHLDWIERWGFTPITFEDCRLYADHKLALPRKPIIITFDDGYLDTFDVAFPILQEYGMQAVIFILGDRSFRTNSWDEFGPKAYLLENHHVLEMSAAGMEIGAHSLTHVKLTDLSEHAAWEEISRSRILLEILLNKPVRTFSYPYGLVNASIKKMVREAGFTHACSVWSGPPSFGKDVFDLRRISILNTTTTSGLAFKVLAPLQYYNWLKWKTRIMIYGMPVQHPDAMEAYSYNVHSTHQHV